MRSPIQETLLFSLAAVLRPIARLLLQAGLGSAEFVAVAKSVFVQVATDEFGLRGRPTNVSRVSAMTGISRKEISRIRAAGPVVDKWTPDLESNPVNTVIHYWHYDPDFSERPGEPRPLRLQGKCSFETLVSRYAGDIPPGAIRAELKRVNTIDEQGDFVVVKRRYYLPAQFDEDLIRRILFSLANLGETIAHNASVYHEHASLTEEGRVRLGRFERAAWTNRLNPEVALQFRQWVREQATAFILDVDGWIGANELPKQQWKSHKPRTLGIGVYYFEDTQ